MKILHTSDWHLGKRSRRIDRAADLRRATEQIFALCAEHDVEVLVIAGDLFDQGGWSDDVCAAVEHLRRAARPFLRGGGTILSVIGNHDKEIVSNTLRHALGLADPSDDRSGELWATGRFHLATRPRFLRLAGRDGQEVQFALMPYPTAGRYLDDSATPYDGADGKRRLLRERFLETLGRIRRDGRFDPGLPSVLVAHIGIAGARLSNRRELSESDGLTLPAEGLGSGWTYVALGDIHRPQTIGNRAHIRYSGSIDRLNADERDDPKGAVLIEVGSDGLVADPTVLPLDATPFLDLTIIDASLQLAALEAGREAIDPRAIVRCRVSFRRGVDDPDEIRRRLAALYPRLLDVTFLHEDPDAAPGAAEETPGAPRADFRTVVLDYLRTRLEGDPLADAVMADVESLIEEGGA